MCGPKTIGAGKDSLTPSCPVQSTRAKQLGDACNDLGSRFGVKRKPFFDAQTVTSVNQLTGNFGYPIGHLGGTVARFSARYSF